MKNDHYLFRGCLIPTRLPFLEKSSRLVLDSLGVKYEPMPGATCCVEPIGLRSMAADTWLVSAARLLSIAEEAGKDILTLCSGCYMSLQEANHMLRSPDMLSKANDVLSSIGREYKGSVRVRHLSAVIKEAGEEKVRSLVTSPLNELRLIAHPGCHMIRPSSIMKVDRHFRPEVLSEISGWVGARVVHTEDWPSCCGGTLGGVDDGLSAKILQDCIRPFAEAGATHIMTPCPFCFFQFDVKQKQLPVLFLSEMIALSFGASPEEIGLKYHKIPVNVRRPR